MTKDQFDKEVQAHVSRFIRDADAKEDARIAQKKLVKHRTKAAKTNSLNRSSMSTLLSPQNAGTKIAEGIISSIEAKYTTIPESKSEGDDDGWCKTCHGEGKNGAKPIDPDTGNSAYFEGKCLDCNGTGKRQAKTNQASQK